MGKFVELTRKELFDLVWSKPLRDVANAIGVSDVAIGKACKRANVPRPPQGYWVTPEGTRPLQPELPKASDHWRGQIVHFDLLDTDKAKKYGAPGRDFARRFEGQLTVAEHLVRPHRLVALARDHQGVERSYRHAPCSLEGADIRVSRAMLPRALRVMDALIKSSESLGDTWQRGEKAMTVICDGVELPVRLTEGGRAEVVPKPEKKRRAAWSQPVWEPPEYEWVGSGELKLFVDVRCQFPAKREWKDSASIPLEEKLADALNGFPKIAAAMKASLREREDWSRKYEAEKKRRESEERKRQEKHVKRRNLRALALASGRSEQIRALCARARRELSALSPELTEWLAWADQEAELLDPLVSNATLAAKLKEAPPQTLDEWWPPVPKLSSWDS